MDEGGDVWTCTIGDDTGGLIVSGGTTDFDSGETGVGLVG